MTNAELLRQAQQQNPELREHLRSDGPLYRLLRGLVTGNGTLFLAATRVTAAGLTIPANTTMTDVCSLTLAIPVKCRLIVHAYVSGIVVPATSPPDMFAELNVDGTVVAHASDRALFTPSLASDFTGGASLVCSPATTHNAGDAPVVKLRVATGITAGLTIEAAGGGSTTDAWLVVEASPVP